MVSDSCSRMFPFPLLSAMQEDRPRTGIVSVSGKQTRNQTPRTTLCHTPPCFPIPHFASNSPFRRRSSVCGQLSAITLPLPGSRNRIMRTAGPPVRQPANLQQKNDPNNVLLFSDIRQPAPRQAGKTVTGQDHALRLPRTALP